MSELKKLNPATFIVPQEGDMRVPGLIIATEQLLQSETIEKPIEQVRNVACLPGIVGYSIAMPDIHWGYGFPIGGVAAMDVETGVISPGGVGYDINCGVRVAIVPIPYSQIPEKTKQSLLDRIFQKIPSGTGQTQLGKERSLSNADFKQLIEKGVRFSIEQGFGFPQDLEHMESRGVLEDANIKSVSKEAMERGKNQLGTIGSGNHFVEIGEIGEIFDAEIAQEWKIEKGLTYVLIHTGSRGFGHQICQDFLNEFIRKGFAENLPDKQLVAAPIRSPEGTQYWEAMASAANFAFNNRQQVLHSVRQAFQEICSIPMDQIRLLYDVCHNIAKMETHKVDGHFKKLCVHRKGATRALGPNSEELAPVFRKTGQPVLVPGDMGRASYLMAGLGNPITWCSACHGAGRAKSRIQSMNAWKGKEAIAHMRAQGVRVKAHSYRTIAEEMPDAYKDVNIVVNAVEEANLAKKIAKLRPFLVLKG